MARTILWTVDGVSLPEMDYPKLERWIAEIARLHGRILGDLAYIFCNDKRILDVNLRFLQHDYFTDIITFDYSRGKLISGDMYISLDTVRSNAEQIKVEYERELLRVIIHGVLHLCGINDKGPGEREIMEANEDEALSVFDSL